VASSVGRNPDLAQDHKAIKAYFTHHIRWAVVDGDGTIAAQSGGIKLARHFGGLGVYVLSFGSSQRNKAVFATTNSTGASTGITYVTATVCGGHAGTSGLTPCPSPFNNASHVQVSTYQNGGSTGGSNSGADEGFYVEVVG
jgi:hypothetical protein